MTMDPIGLISAYSMGLDGGGHLNSENIPPNPPCKIAKIAIENNSILFSKNRPIVIVKIPPSSIAEPLWETLVI